MGFQLISPPVHAITFPVGETVLPGYFVKACSVTDPVSTDSWVGHIYAMACNASGDDNLCVGIALGSIISGNTVNVATDGIYQLPAAYAIIVGGEVGAPVSDPLSVRAASYTCTGSTNALQYIKPVGTALSTAASGEQCLFKLNL